MLQLVSVAISYWPLLIALWFGVGYAPGLAVFPRAIKTPLLFAAIPLVSLLIVNSLALVLIYTHYYNHLVVLAVILLLSVIAIIRLFRLSLASQWSLTHKQALFFNFCFLLPLIAFTGLSSFMTNDALASWHYWAMYFYQSKIPNTAGYPPFFPIFISFCYKLVGSSEYQGPVKAFLCILPFTLLNAIAFTQLQHKPRWIVIFFLMITCVFPGFLTWKMYAFYQVGYADPLLAASVVMSVALWMAYLYQPEKKAYLWLGAFTAMVASLSKQPGLLWILFSLPLIVICQSHRTKKLDKQAFAALLASMLPALLWLLGAGSQFYNNQGVITASLKKSSFSLMDVFTTLVGSMQTYFLWQPTLLLIFLWAGYIAYKKPIPRIIMLTFILPALLLWFIFGSYHMRLGLHVIGVCALLIAAHSSCVEKSTWLMCCETFIKQHMLAIQRGVFIIFVTGFIVFSILLQTNPFLNVPGRVYPLNAGRFNMYHYFGSAAAFVYQVLYDKPDLTIWTPNRYIEGLFYGHTPVLTPADTNGIAGILQHKVDYVILSGKILPESYAGFDQRLQQCPNCFTEIPVVGSYYHFKIYRVNP